ncbi:MAG TPA: VWA domain-containing protein, partial [Thermoanaerobaculia bacterium]|nr:VWA domain-containing protein [Thermoanaerobaculia bacterium]
MRRPQTLFVVSLLAAPLFAQAPVIEKIDVSVVNVDVTVTDRAGNPVRGLTRDDFEVLEDGRPQPITNFYVVEHAPAANIAALSTMSPEPDERFRRRVLVIVDNLSTTRYERDQALARLEEFISDRFRGGEYDWSIAALDTHVRMLLPPTSDKQAIHAALAEI